MRLSGRMRNFDGTVEMQAQIIILHLIRQWILSGCKSAGGSASGIVVGIETKFSTFCGIIKFY
jgi:hypothetical protein